MTPAKLQIQAAFDRHATIYDERFGRNPLAQHLRARTWQVIDRVFDPGMHVIDLGCGTGEDALHLAGRGLFVTAVDISPGMIKQVEEKARARGLLDRIQCSVVDIESYDVGGARFDGLLSNFGTLNCVPDLACLGRLARTSLKSGAHLVFTVMGRFYPLELTLHLLKGQPRQASRRWSPNAEAVVEGLRIQAYYHGLGSIRRALGSSFDLETAIGLNLLLPVPGLEHVERYWPQLFRWIQPIDSWLSTRRPTRSWGDHFISVWRYKGD